MVEVEVEPARLTIQFLMKKYSLSERVKGFLIRKLRNGYQKNNYS